MARYEAETTGVMFRSFGPQGWPSVVDVDRANFLNIHGLDLPDEIRNDWLVVAWNPRVLTYYDEGNEAMDETNYAVVLDTVKANLDGGYVTHVPIISHAMGVQGDPYLWHTVGVADALAAGCAVIGSRYGGDVLAVRPGFYGLGDLAALRDQLESYPLLDESAYSELEYEAWQEYAPDAFRGELRDAARDDRYNEATIELLEANADELLSIFEAHLHYSYGFSGEYSPDFLDIYDGMVSDDDPPDPDWHRDDRNAVRALADPRTGHALAALLRGTYDGPVNYVPGQLTLPNEPWCNHDAPAVRGGVCECGEIVLSHQVAR